MRIAIVYPAQRYSTYDCALGYTKAFRRLAINTTEIHYELLCERYRENTYRKASRHVVLEVVEQDPDLVIVIDGTKIHDLFWNWMKRLGIRTAVVMTDCPYYDKVNAVLAEKADYPFANDLLSAQVMGVPYLPLAYSSEIHHPFVVSNKYKSDVVFVGTGFPERTRFLEQVDWDGIDFKLFGGWDLEWDSPLARFINQDKEFLPNDEAAQYYNGAKIVLNLDRYSVDRQGITRIERRKSVGPRVYEVAACGSLLASHNTVDELDSLLGDNCLKFDTPSELSEILREWLDKEEERKRKADNARRAVRNESYTHRAMKLLDLIES